MSPLNVLAALDRSSIGGLDLSLNGGAILYDANDLTGTFCATSNDISSQVTDDATQAFIIPMSADPSGASGGFKRIEWVFDVHFFGAVGKSGINDTAAIQAASDLCGKWGGGYVIFRNKQYSFSSINVPKNYVKFRGQGMDATQLLPDGSADDAFLFYSGDPARVMQYNGVFDLSIIPQANINRGIHVQNHYWFMARDVKIIAKHATGFEFENGQTSYTAILQHCLCINSSANGCLLGANGTGDLQNVIILNCNFSGGGTGNGLCVRNCGGLIWVGGECLQKDTGMRLAPNLSGYRAKGGYISQVFFDTSVNDNLALSVAVGAIIAEFTFALCSFNNSQNKTGVTIEGPSSDPTLINSINFIGCAAVINKAHGFYTAYCRDIELMGFKAMSNGQDSISSGIFVSAGTQIFKMIGGKSGSGAGFSPSQRYGVYVAAATSDVIIDKVSLYGNVLAPVCDLGSPGIIIDKCPGVVTRAKGAASVSAGSTSVTISHGLSFTPAKEDFIIKATSDSNGIRYWPSAVSPTSFTVSVAPAAASTFWFGWEVRIKGN
ncbi:hypothetical protein G6L30_08315 [Agrobacterium rhizogenes]|nr:hypothetical protein [Rhizobium rhizogenes]